MTFDEQLRRYADMTDDMLRALLSDGEIPTALRESMAYSLFAGGKRLRPVLCLGSCVMLGGDESRALPPACAVEMIHAYSLIHDDLPAMDNDDMRRGKPSSHVAFGEGGAILAGDGLQALAFLTMAKAGNPRAYAALAKGAFDMVAGQSYDLTESAHPEMLTTIHRLKTGALIRAAVLAGAYSASPAEQEIAALERFSEAFGLLFQITDDILDEEKDAAEGKLTFVTKLGRRGARAEAERTATEAKAALGEFGERAAFLAELTDLTAKRRK